MSYIYDGALSPSTLDGIKSMMKSYPNPVELSAIPAREVLASLPLHASEGEDCMGGKLIKTTRLFGIVHKNFNDKAAGIFLFLCSVAEKQIVLDACPDLIVNAQPFKSMI